MQSYSDWKSALLKWFFPPFVSRSKNHCKFPQNPGCATALTSVPEHTVKWSWLGIQYYSTFLLSPLGARFKWPYLQSRKGIIKRSGYKPGSTHSFMTWRCANFQSYLLKHLGPIRNKHQLLWSSPFPWHAWKSTQSDPGLPWAFFAEKN